MELGVRLALSWCDSLGASISAVPIVRDTRRSGSALQVVGLGSQWSEILRPAQHRCGNAVVVIGWRIRREHEIPGAAAKTIGHPTQLRLFENRRPPQNCVVPSFGAMLTDLNVVHLRFPSRDLERAHVLRGNNVTETRRCHDAQLSYSLRNTVN